MEWKIVKINITNFDHAPNAAWEAYDRFVLDLKASGYLVAGYDYNDQEQTRLATEGARP